LTEQTTIPALTIALHNRKPPAGLIFHSDGAWSILLQRIFKTKPGHIKIKNSMCDVVYENAHAERVNGN
jgi:hypothetical protein